MMTNAEVLYEGIKFGMTLSASKGAKMLMDEFVEQFTPAELDNKGRICIEIAKWGAAAAFGNICSNAVEMKLEKGKAWIVTGKKILKAIEDGKNVKIDKGEVTVIDTDENNSPVEIIEDVEVATEDLDSLD